MQTVQKHWESCTRELDREPEEKWRKTEPFELKIQKRSILTYYKLGLITEHMHSYYCIMFFIVHLLNIS